MATDTSQRFVINDSGVRGQWVMLEACVQTVLAKHDYPMEVQSLLGELMAAATLLTATLKFEGALTIQARGNGPVNLITVECTHQNELRGVARWQGDVQGKSFQELMEDATLAITIIPLNGQRYQGVVPLLGENLAQCLEHYFQSSEQLKTQLQLFSGNNRAGGLLIQVLPESSTSETEPERRQEEWDRITALASTLSPEEFLTLDCPTLLYRLFHEEKVSLFNEEPVAFHCTCSTARTAEALIQLGEEELKRILTERGQIDVTCQFCNQHYRFDSVDVAVLFQDKSTISNPQGSH